jgi:hypothetical protein
MQVTYHFGGERQLLGTHGARCSAVYPCQQASDLELRTVPQPAVAYSTPLFKLFSIVVLGSAQKPCVLLPLTLELYSRDSGGQV